jgi:predicted RNase H-like HicB family nuclease
MSARSKSSSKEIDRPFSPDILKQARALARKYQVVLAFEYGEWYGRGLELSHVYADGKTPGQCVAKTRDALVSAVATLIERGEKPPAPAQSGQRTTQVNVRLTADEKSLLEATARSKGFHGLSDFIRAAALQSSG